MQEHAFDSSYAQQLGVDVDNLLISQPDNGEQALEIADSLIRSSAIDIIVIDSVAATDSESGDRRGDGRLEDGPAGTSDVPGAAQADGQYLEDQDRLHLHQPAA